MADLEPRRVPVDTNEITYTGKGGRQVSIPVTRKGKYAYATPATRDDVAALDALGHDTVARKADDAAEETAKDEKAPATGEQEG